MIGFIIFSCILLALYNTVMLAVGISRKEREREKSNVRFEGTDDPNIIKAIVTRKDGTEDSINLFVFTSEEAEKIREIQRKLNI